MTTIRSITPTPFLRREGEELRQTARLAVAHAGPPCAAELHVVAEGKTVVTPLTLPAGASTLDIEAPELAAPGALQATLVVAGRAVAQVTAPWQPPRHWVVHVVQNSHHDVGYTDLPAHVLVEHDGMLDAAIDMAAATRDYPDDARFRIVIEQAWSIEHFLRHAPPARRERMLALLRGGDFELTALFGNLTTELCGHETLARSVYAAFRLKREHGIPIVSAEHNDIPGFTWGLSQVLTAAGIRLFCPGLPLYYNWGYPHATSFWDEAAIFGYRGPGAFWWEAPSGQRLLFWCNNAGCGGDCHPALPQLADRLQELADGNYPYPVLRWPVIGGARDNSPYILGFAETIRAWNDRWAFPRLICSTNARFYADLLPQLPASLPVWRGELPGQDYPVGAASTADATAVNRRNHADLPAAEALGAMAVTLADYRYQHEFICDAYADILWHDEHTWGHHLPAGPCARASEMEKAGHAHHAAVLAHDVSRKAMARVADAVHLPEPGLHLVVFNALGQPRGGEVRMPLREFANCGIDMVLSEDGRLHSAALQDRHPEGASPEMLAGNFALIDIATGAEIPYHIAEITSPFDPVPHAAQRLGRGQRERAQGFDRTAGIQCDLVFHAEDVPALGYRSYQLQPRETPPAFPLAVQIAGNTLENRWYRLALDAAGNLCSLIDKETGREWVDENAPHPFGSVLVRDPYGDGVPADFDSVEAAPHGLRVRASAPGFPRIEITYALPDGEKAVEVAVRLLADPTPLLESYLAFPFRLPEGRFRYQGPLCVVDPTTELLPGAYADRLAVQDWVTAASDDGAVLWSALDAPVVSLGRLWPGRVSPAHASVVRADIEHPRPDADTLRGGAIYALLTANNFGTNFAASQCGDLLFRFRFTTRAHPLTAADASGLGRHFQTPLGAGFTARPLARIAHPLPPASTSGASLLPPAGSFLAVEPPAVQLVALKRAEDGHGLIARLWNTGDAPVNARLTLPLLTVNSASLVTLAEEDTGEQLTCEGHEVTVRMPPRSVVTVRLYGGRA